MTALLFLVALLTPRECTQYTLLCDEWQAKCDNLVYPLVQRQPACDRARRCKEDRDRLCGEKGPVRR